ncbi:FAD-dependent oxidoreductase [Marinobacter sp. NFXS9]|uniref:NAD(P)/FAD-dependent oxidoreductase n=1 Tax=Marinobacter sp. NFXS9 TaxID=2818433 RepID=UPI0032DEDE25
MPASTTDIAIIGGGILGCAIADRLSATPGLRVTVIERHGLGEQTTSHAAALLTRARPNPAMARLVGETFDTIESLSDDSGSALPLRKVGSLHVAESDDGLDQLTATAHHARNQNLTHVWIDATEAMARAPWLNVSAEARALWFPGDGYIDPYQLCQAYAARARNRRARFLLGTTVTEICRNGHRVNGLQLSTGDRLNTDQVIDAAGPWSVALASAIDVPLAMGAVRSHYWITAKDERVYRDGPITILPDSRSYARPEVGGLLFGLRDRQAVFANPGALPNHLSGFAFNTDSDGQAALLEGAPELARQCPLIESTPLAHYVSNISSYTPDGRPLLGTLPGLEGFMAATGCSGAGIGLSGGIARLIAELALRQSPFVDASPFRPDRFGPVNPFDPAFQHRCALARADKRTG